MCPPGLVKRAMKTRDQLAALDMISKNGANGIPKGSLSLVPIRDIEDASQIASYSEEEMKLLRHQ